MNILSNFKLTDEQRTQIEQRLPRHLLLPGNAKTSGRFILDDAEIAWGQLTAEEFRQAHRLKLVQLTSAGYTQFDTDEIRDQFRARQVILCNGSSVHDEPCAQHAVAMILALSRGLPRSVQQQQNSQWLHKSIEPELNLLRGKTVAIVGYGAIARRMVEMLRPFNIKITAFRRKPRGDENCTTLELDHLNAALGKSDYVVNLLPEAPSTHGFFDTVRLDAIQRGGVFINIGRGKTVDQAALIATLQDGRLSAAAIDVTEPEPAPPDDPIWKTPNLLITPHVAGEYVGMQADLFEFLVSNVERFDRGESLIDRVI